MFIAFPDCFKNRVLDVSPDFWRIQAVKIQFKSSSLLLINSYFPTDPQRNNCDESELLETLGHVRNTLLINSCDKVLWAGDINSDFTRNSSHTRQVQDTLDQLGLIPAWTHFSVDFTASCEMLGQTFTSILDHFFWNSGLDSCVEEAGVLHSPDNRSDHSPIFCVINNSAIDQEVTLTKRCHNPRPSWKRSNQEQKSDYRDLLETQLGSLAVPESLHCSNVHCTDTHHKEALDSFTLEVLEAVQNAAEDTLTISQPGATARARPSRPGWRDEVKSYRDSAFFWHQIWKSCGRPLNTQLHNVMKRSRNQYHYQYKKCKKAEDKIKRSKLLSACMGEGGDLFKELKALRKSAPTVANSIDGVSDNVPGHFGSIYSKLYNSAADAHKLQEVHEHVEELVHVGQADRIAEITPALLKKAVGKLRPGKSDAVYSFSSDCFKCGPDNLFTLLALIIRSCTVHQHVAPPLLLSTLVPLVKDKLGNIHSSKNYRSVAISSILLKIIDWVIILLDGSCLGLSELQFAYQAGCSREMCTWAALETIDYFLKNGSEVFTCATDMTKAFDLTLHSLMFSKMLEAGMTPVLVRLLMFIYANQVANVSWNGEFSETFSVKNGCGQGKVLAGIAYCLYCEELFTILRRRRSGCWVQGYFRGIVGYSDDNWLLAPSLEALQDMISTCEEYARSHNLQFSTDIDPLKCKTKCMAFLHAARPLASMYLCGNPLPWVDKLKHLGSIISNKIDGCQVDISQKRAQYIQKNNSIAQEFLFAHPTSKIELNKIYNSHFSGSNIWNIFSPGARQFESTYNKSVRLMCGLPYQTHRYLVESLVGGQGFRVQLIKKFLGFIKGIKESKKPIMRNLYNLVKSDVRTTTGNNLRNILLMTNLGNIEDLEPSTVSTINYNCTKVEDMWRLKIIKEIMDIQNEKLNCPEGWNNSDLQEILNFACVS